MVKRFLEKFLSLLLFAILAGMLFVCYTAHAAEESPDWIEALRDEGIEITAEEEAFMLQYPPGSNGGTCFEFAVQMHSTVHGYTYKRTDVPLKGGMCCWDWKGKDTGHIVYILDYDEESNTITAAEGNVISKKYGPKYGDIGYVRYGHKYCLDDESLEDIWYWTVSEIPMPNL